MIKTAVSTLSKFTVIIETAVSTLNKFTVIIKTAVSTLNKFTLIIKRAVSNLNKFTSRFMACRIFNSNSSNRIEVIDAFSSSWVFLCPSFSVCIKMRVF